MITSCDFRFVCPMKWDEMVDLPDGSGKYCDHCQRSVITVHTRRQFNAAAKREDCVAVFPEGEEKLPRLTGVPHEMETNFPSPLSDSRHGNPSEAPAAENTPPFLWSEIEENLARPKRAPRGDSRPAVRPPCPRCQQPMRWIYFRSSLETWELECGRAGWTPICRDCRTWLACRVTRMS